MQRIRMYQIDAFTDRLFSGNPAAVCILDTPISDVLMQSIANENNLAETAFIVPGQQEFEIRWFTPTTEVDLCGHATLASAFVLFNELKFPDTQLRFKSLKSGTLLVTKQDDMLLMDFPTDTIELVNGQFIQEIEDCIGVKVVELYKGKSDYIAVIDSEKTLINLQPDFKNITRLQARGLVVTAKGEEVDFVSRFFAPQLGIDEDPVTGSAHTSLLPFWSRKLGRDKLIARQLSKRGGQLFCEYNNDRCLIGGNARLFLKGELIIE